MESLRESPPQADEALLEVLKETHLESFATKLCVHLQLTKLEHFDYTEDGDLEQAGLSAPAIRRLRAGIEEKRKKSSKLRQFFKGKERLSSFRASTERKNSSEGENGREEVSRQRRKNRKVEKGKQRGEGTEEGAESGVPACLISSDKIKLMEKIGEGSFAVVSRAVWDTGSGKKDVAVKLLRDSASFSEELQQEVDHMHHLRHPNLIRLHGLVFPRPIMMVVELCDGGALLDRLRDGDKPVVLASVLINYCLQIAKGMAHLELKHFIHRDLAARNVLLTADEKVVKIGDFGLMRALPERDTHYVMSKEKKVPFAWCPPESLKRRQFSHASDVWSFAVTLWEMFSFGEEPWCGDRGSEILQKVQDGERLKKPAYCPSALYQIMLQCWAIEPEKRPTFQQLKEILKEAQLETGTSREEQKGDETLLGTVTGDPIIVIDGCPEQYYWFGQNKRTRKFGKFPRKIFKPHGSSKHQKDISMPIKGSFIHAGHGDARGGESWGNPDKIDPIILSNPMPEAVLIELGSPSPTDNRKSVPESIPSIMNLGGAAPISRRHQSESPINPNGSLAPNGSQQRPWSVQFGRSTDEQHGLVAGSSSHTVQEEDEVDPFAPFPYDDLGSTVYGYTPSNSLHPVASSPAVYDSVPPDSYGQVPNDSGYRTQNSIANPDFSSLYSKPTTGSGFRSERVTTFQANVSETQSLTEFSSSPNSASSSAIFSRSPGPTQQNSDSNIVWRQQSPDPTSTKASSPSVITPITRLSNSLLHSASPPPQVQHVSNGSHNMRLSPAGIAGSSNSAPKISPPRNSSPASSNLLTSRISPPKMPRLPAPTPVPKRTSDVGSGIGRSIDGGKTSSPAESGVPSNSTPLSQNNDNSSMPNVPVSLTIDTIGASEPDPFEISQTTMEMLSRPRYNQFYQSEPSAPSSNSSAVPSMSSQSLSQSHLRQSQAPMNPVSNVQPSSSAELRPHSQPGSLAKNEETQKMVAQLSDRLSQISARVNSISNPSSSVSPRSGASFSGPPTQTYNSNSIPRMPYQAFTTTGLTSGFNTAPHPVSSQARSRPSSVTVSHAGSSQFLTGFGSGANRSTTPIGPGSGRVTLAGHPEYSLGQSEHLMSSPSLGNQIRASSVPDVAPAVLDLFDPLSSRAPTDLVQQVQRAAPFVADSERCSTILRRCRLNVDDAVKELKVQKLLDTGIAADREKAIVALDKYSWDVNAAAEALLG